MNVFYAMLLEDLILLITIGLGVFLIGIPAYQIARAIIPKRRNSVVEAKQRLEAARVELEAARLNAETEKVYTNLYRETLDDTNLEETNTRNGEKHSG